MKTTTELNLIPIDKLVPYANNARTHSQEQILKLRSSLREFGFVSPVIVDREYNIIAGHGRVLAAKAEGIAEVPCVFVDHLTPAQKKAYILADNRMALDAGWDEELLKIELEELQGVDFDLALTGFDEKELSKLFDIGADAKEDDFDLDKALEKPAIGKRGDVWTLGKHRLVCGDSTSEADIKTLMGEQKADLVITDAPYNVNYGARGKQYRERGGYACGMESRTILNDNMDSEAFHEFLVKCFTNMSWAMKGGAAFYEWFATKEHVNFETALKECGLECKQELIWVKNTFTLGRQDYQWQHEPCFYGWRADGSHTWYGDRKQSTILNYDRPKKNDLHPTQKPLEMIGYLMKQSSKTDDIVLDIFGGSGTTLIAAEQLNRVCYTMELDEKYASVIVRRYVELVGSGDKVSCVREGKTYTYKELEADETE